MSYKVSLVRKREIADGTMAFYFSKPEGFDFRPGQTIDLSLINPQEIDTKGNTRTLSIASAPYEPELIVATRLRGSAFKTTLHDMSNGTSVEIDGPFGDFTLHKDINKPAVFLIGGIGVTPVRSMVAQALHDNSGHQLVLIHANRKFIDIPFATDFAQMAQDNSNFKYVETLTAFAPDDWNSERGRIDEAMVNKYVQNIKNPIYYLSGPEGMVKSMRDLLINMSVSEDNIRSEEFPGY